MPHNMKWSLMSVALVLAILFAVAPAQASEPAPAAKTAEFETEFMMDMIDHHYMAVHMSMMCVERAIHPELVATCQDIIATQSAEIEMMQMWLSDWYGIDYEPVMSHQHHRMMERMMAMSPEEFEIHFMKSMIQHHRGAIREGQMCLKRAYHEDLLMLCQNIVETQTDEIETMRMWLCEWYDKMCED